jgi:hypothetical protein
MQAYKFTTRISENGIISLPLDPRLFNKEVEIIVLPKESKVKIKKTTAKKTSAMDFYKKFSGVLKNLPVEDTKI